MTFVSVFTVLSMSSSVPVLPALSFVFFSNFVLFIIVVYCIVLSSSAACSVLAGEVPAPPLVRDHRELGGHQADEGMAARVEAVSG